MVVLVFPANLRCAFSPPPPKGSACQGLPSLQLPISWLQQPVQFVANDSFSDAPLNNNPLVDQVLHRHARNGGAGKTRFHQQAKLAPAEIFSPEQETAFFREMNLLKYQAEMLRRQLVQKPGPDKGEKKLIAFESLLAQSQQIRDCIITANMRLVASIAKKYVTPSLSFDDLLSEGTLILMQTVERFDYARGYRFSTYAYRSIIRGVYQHVVRFRQKEATLGRQADPWTYTQQEDVRLTPRQNRQLVKMRQLTERHLQQLDQREQFIVQHRYALGSCSKEHSFREIGERLGVSKERARQLEKRAVEKLRAMVAAVDVEEP